METRVELAEQVVRFVARQAPEPRRVLRAALRGLAKERGDIRVLEGPLQEYHRLRVGAYRVVFKYRASARRRIIQCIFAERRSAVYELFEHLLKQHLLRSEEED
jgi:mRNA-degrading endonuclease RelE of RelBE toxin-antitoxin system